MKYRWLEVGTERCPGGKHLHVSVWRLYVYCSWVEHWFGWVPDVLAEPGHLRAGVGHAALGAIWMPPSSHFTYIDGREHYVGPKR